jgi:hypothetical protein
MKKTTFSQKKSHSGQKGSSGDRRWTKLFALLFALLIPGLPQILSRRKHHFLGSLLFFCGTGALISILLSMFISGDAFQVMDLTYAPAVPNFSYPGDFIISTEDSDKLIPISPPEEYLFIQPFFWELWYSFIFLYLFCAVISCGDQWRGRHQSYEKPPTFSANSG